MKTIKKNNTLETVVKNSKFICFLYNVSNIEEIDTILKTIKTKYKDATHICYAYRLENKEKAFDDKEPSGSAGAPILEVLKKNDLYNTLAVVVRYFGGIKLGAGGLIRTYSKCVRETLKENEIQNLIYYNYYTLEANYDDLKLLNNLTKDIEIVSKDFEENIVYKIKTDKEKDNVLKIFEKTNIKVKN